jgi:hypothetical protein
MGYLALGATAMTRGALVAVCGVGAGDLTIAVSRLVAAELARGAPAGTVLLTSLRGPSSHLDPPLSRHSVVVADVGALDDGARALEIASLVVCVLAADAAPAAVASAATSPAAQFAASKRWVAVLASSDRAVAREQIRHLLRVLPFSVRMVTQLPADAADEPVIGQLARATLRAALA